MLISFADSRYFLLFFVFLPLLSAVLVAFIPARWSRSIVCVMSLLWGVHALMLYGVIEAFRFEYLHAFWWSRNGILSWHMGWNADVFSLIAASLGVVLAGVSLSVLGSGSRVKADALALCGVCFGWMCVAFAGDLLTLCFGYNVLMLSVWGAIVLRAQTRNTFFVSALSILVSMLCGMLPMIFVSAHHLSDVRFLEEGAMAPFVNPREGARFLWFGLIGLGAGWMTPLLVLMMGRSWRASVQMGLLAVFSAVVGCIGLFAWYKTIWFGLGEVWLREEWLTAFRFAPATLLVVSALLLWFGMAAWLARDVLLRVLCLQASHWMLGVLAMLVLPPLLQSVALYHWVMHGVGVFLLWMLWMPRVLHDRVVRGWRFLLSVLSMTWAGVPPMGGFLTLWWMHSGEWDGEWFWFVEMVVMCSVIVNVCSALRFWQEYERPAVSVVGVRWNGAAWFLMCLLCLWSVFPGALLMVVGR